MDVAVHPFTQGMLFDLVLEGFLFGGFFFSVVDVLAVGVVTGIEMGAVSHGFVSRVGDQGSEVPFGAAGTTLDLETAVASAVLAVFEPVFVLEGVDLLLLFEADVVVVQLLLGVGRFEQGGDGDNIADPFLEFFFLLCLHFFLLLKGYGVWRLRHRPLVTGFFGQLHDGGELHPLDEEDEPGAIGVLLDLEKVPGLGEGYLETSSLMILERSSSFM